jgi:hypothetical protein
MSQLVISSAGWLKGNSPDSQATRRRVASLFLCKEVETATTKRKTSCRGSTKSTFKQVVNMQVLENKATPPRMPFSQTNHDLPEPVMPERAVLRLLKGQKALVTGASSGIGKAIALALGHAGADVCVNYVSGADKAQEIVDHLGEHGFKAFAYQADVSKEDQVVAMFDAMREEFGTVDIVINNAGLQQDAPVDQMTLAQWQKVIDVNLTGQFLCSREAVREVQAPRRAPGNFVRGWEDHLRELGARSYSVGWPCELRSIEGRRDAHDEKHRPGSRPVSHPC